MIVVQESMLRRLRQARAKTLEEVAGAVGLSTDGYKKIELGQRRANAYAAKRIAEFFGLPILDLFLPATYTVRLDDIGPGS